MLQIKKRGLNINGFGCWGENNKKHSIWGHNSHTKWCLSFYCYININGELNTKLT